MINAMEEKTLEELQALEKRVSNLLDLIRSRIRLIELDNYRAELDKIKSEL